MRDPCGDRMCQLRLMPEGGVPCNPAFAGRAFQPSTGAVKKLSKNFAMALAMSEQDVITPLTFGAPKQP
ncbi:hypothetical protein F3P66_11945 [Agrobacterium fabrum]|uniref:Uncharacterized protein n=1 Tax=Agrobacterium fabrum (strain C58 / ATCC 33970) TaxID=176299 RepID=Q8U5J9_AGRFC|nr:hypothetical protein Atu8010 [Agrobacterium fabrum str. C58]QRM60070.1 hypothetical protein F3P66_11945 [Agrobacterium fabrum]TRB31510.1 hypothetical protein EXN51_05090 [Agrobacterium fabrum]